MTFYKDIAQKYDGLAWGVATDAERDVLDLLDYIKEAIEHGNLCEKCASPTDEFGDCSYCSYDEPDTDEEND